MGVNMEDNGRKEFIMTPDFVVDFNELKRRMAETRREARKTAVLVFELQQRVFEEVVINGNIPSGVCHGLLNGKNK